MTDISGFYTQPQVRGSYALDPSFSVRFNVPHYPCWFYRMMQRVFFGIYWRKA